MKPSMKLSNPGRLRRPMHINTKNTPLKKAERKFKTSLLTILPNPYNGCKKEKPSMWSKG